MGEGKGKVQGQGLNWIAIIAVLLGRRDAEAMQEAALYRYGTTTRQVYP